MISDELLKSGVKTMMMLARSMGPVGVGDFKRELLIQTVGVHEGNVDEVFDVCFCMMMTTEMLQVYEMINPQPTDQLFYVVNERLYDENGDYIGNECGETL